MKCGKLNLTLSMEACIKRQAVAKTMQVSIIIPNSTRVYFKAAPESFEFCKDCKEGLFISKFIDRLIDDVDIRNLIDLQIKVVASRGYLFKEEIDPVVIENSMEAETRSAAPSISFERLWKICQLNIWLRRKQNGANKTVTKRERPVKCHDLQRYLVRD